MYDIPAATPKTAAEITIVATADLNADLRSLKMRSSRRFEVSSSNLSAASDFRAISFFRFAEEDPPDGCSSSINIWLGARGLFGGEFLRMFFLGFGKAFFDYLPFIFG